MTTLLDSLSLITFRLSMSWILGISDRSCSVTVDVILETLLWFKIANANRRTGFACVTMKPYLSISVL